MKNASAPLVVTAAFPFVPADLNMAHMASTYVPADIYTRIQKMLGRKCVFISGIDVHSIQVSSDGRTRAGAEPLCTDYTARYRKNFEAMNIACDSFARTDHPEHIALVNEVLFRLHEGGHFAVRPRTVSVCPLCKAAPPPRLARDLGKQLGCPYCEGVLKDETRDHIYLRLEPHFERLAQLYAVVTPKDQHKWLSGQLKEPPPDWCISRDHRVGLPLPFGRPGLSLYLWMESLIGYETQARWALGERPDDLRFVHFIGKNIQYYHAVAWPVLLRYGLNRPDDCFRCSGRGFLNIDRSTPGLVDIDAAVASFHQDWLRLFLALKVRDGQAD